MPPTTATTATSATPARRATSTRALPALIRAQATALLRDRMYVGFALIFPPVLLLMIGLAFPGAAEASEDFGGRRLVDVYAPVAIVFALLTTAFSVLPGQLATARERGIMRRLSTTPVGPARMVAAQLVVHVAVSAVAAALTVLAAVLVLDVPAPANPLGLVVAFAAAAASLLAVGLLVGSVVGTASGGQGVGMAAFFPALFLSGVYVPRDVMPDGVRAVSDWSAPGAATSLVTETWAGAAPGWDSLLVMAVTAVVALLVAARVFRWS